MADRGDNNFIRYVYRGEEDEIIPREATHITVAKSVTIVRANAFRGHPNIVEIICHDGVEKIEREAFYHCPVLQRVIMPGVKIVWDEAFCSCDRLQNVECDKLEVIKDGAFWNCPRLRSVDLLSARTVEWSAFNHTALRDVKFGSKLERINDSAFGNCFALQRITIPLKDGLLVGDVHDGDDIFIECHYLRHVDVVEGELQETVAALHLEDWRNDMNEEIDSINRILPNAAAGYEWDYDADEYGDPGEKAQAIRSWIRSVLGKIIHYQAEQESLLNEAATTLQFVLPQYLVTNNVVSFLALPSHSFEVEEDGVEDDHDDMYANGSYSEGEDSGMEVDNSDDEEE